MTEKPGTLNAFQKKYEAMTPQQRRSEFWKLYAELLVYIVLMNVYVFGSKLLGRPEAVNDTLWTSLIVFGPLPLVWRIGIVTMRLVRLRFVEERRSPARKE